MNAASASVDLHWIPLGAGNPIVTTSGRWYEALAARRQARPRQALFHSALTLRLGERRVVIEQTPVPRGDPRSRGVVAGGPVGAARWGRFRVFRYEVRCWDGGDIPDLGAAVGPPITLSTEVAVAARIIEVAPSVPELTWGRDPGGMGEMWNSNSVVAWLLTAAGLDVSGHVPPHGGRAPGWLVGVAVAAGVTHPLP